jgi:glycosyltransferase 2 family protein
LSSGAKKRALAWLRTGLALLLLGVAAYLVPWEDQLVCVQGKQEVKASGTLHGNWREDVARFSSDPVENVDPCWPPEIAAGLRAGGEFEVRRTSPGSGSAQVDWKPGMLRVLREVEPGAIFGALLLILGGAVVAITRWWRLLAVAGCPTRWTSAFRLSFLGFFFNIVLPAGITGGDVIKAVLVVRENPERRADAFVTVVVDRALGLLVLMGLAVVVVLVSGDRFAELRLPVVLAFFGTLFALWILLYQPARRWLGLSALLERMPQKDRLKSIERALRLYSEKPLEILVAVVLSGVNHLCIGGSVCVLGRSFGADLSYIEYLGVAAIANTISSIPIAPSGWGVGELAFGYLFKTLGSPGTIGVAVSVTYRLLGMLVGLAGGLFLLMPGGRTIRAEIEQEKKEEVPA